MKNLILMLLLILPFSIMEAKKPIEAGKEIIHAFAAKESFDKDWQLKSFGWNLEEKKIQTLKIGFRVFEMPTLESARNNMLGAIEELIHYINADEKNKEYFSVFPISEKNLDVSISYVNEKGIMIKNNPICSTLMINSTLFYSHNAEKKLENIHKESYTDALKNLQKETSLKWLKAPVQE